jgi:transposase
MLIDGIRWRAQTGAPWRDLPPCYGPWQTVYGLFRRWQRLGVWTGLLTKLQARANAHGRIGWTVNVDSTICRAHQHAAGARRDGQAQKEPPGGLATEPADHALGRSRGGLTTKIHLACEQGQKPLAILVTAGQRGDSPQFTAVLEAIRVPCDGPGRPRARPDRVLGDKAYSSRVNRDYLRRRGITCTIPEPADQIRNRKRRGRSGGRPPAFDREDYKGRHAIECGINRLKPPSRRLPLRQARRPIPGDRARRCDRRVAVRGRRPGMPSCPAIAIRVPRRFRDPTYHRADSENGDHIDDPSGGRHQRHRVRDRLVAQRAVAAQANKLRRQRSTTWPSVPRGSGGRRL